MADVDEFLEHYGVPGMRWGFRRTKDGTYKRSGNRVKELSEDASTVRDIQGKRSTKGTQSLSNKELQTVITRLQLEKQLNQLSPSAKSKGKKAAGDMLDKFSKQTTSALVTAASAAVAAALIGVVKGRSNG